MPISKIKGSAINDDAITTAKIVDDAVTSEKVTDNIEIDGTEAIRVPTGTTAQRANAQVGDLRYNSDNEHLEQYTPDGWQGIAPPPVITSTTGEINEDDDTTITINGSNFGVGATVQFVNFSDNSLIKNSPTVTRVSGNQLTATTGNDSVSMTAGTQVSIKVTNPSGLASTLDNQFTVGQDPQWTTSSGSLATLRGNDIAVSNISLTAATPDVSGDTITYAVTSGSLPNGLSLNSSGTISGIADFKVSGSTTSSFDVTATSDSDSNATTARSFSITNSSPFADDLIAWYKADVGVTTSGGFVDQWDDQSGNGRHLYDGVVTGSVNRPSYQSSGGANNQPYLQFATASGTPAALATNNSTAGDFWGITNSNGPITVICVYQSKYATSERGGVWGLSNSNENSDNLINLYHWDAASGGHVGLNTFNSDSYGVANDYNTYYNNWVVSMWSFREDNTAAYAQALRLNGTDTNTSQVYNTQTVNLLQNGDYINFTVGNPCRAAQADQHLVGQMSEVMILKTNFGDASLSMPAVEAYLSDKYGISVSSSNPN